MSSRIFVTISGGFIRQLYATRSSTGGDRVHSIGALDEGLSSAARGLADGTTRSGASDVAGSDAIVGGLASCRPLEGRSAPTARYLSEAGRYSRRSSSVGQLEFGMSSSAVSDGMLRWEVLRLPKP